MGDFEGVASLGVVDSDTAFNCVNDPDQLRLIAAGIRPKPEEIDLVVDATWRAVAKPQPPALTERANQSRNGNQVTPE